MFRNRSFLILVILILCFMFIAGCSNINIDSTFAGLDRYQIMISDDGTVNVIGDPGPDYNFSGWKDIKSVSVGGHNAAGVKKDGTVYVTGNKWFSVLDASGWTDIKMLEFTDDEAIGLKNDGTIIYTNGSGTGDLYINNQLDKWTDIKQVDTSSVSIIGVKCNGDVVAISSLIPEFKEEVEKWKDVIWVSASFDKMIGLTNGGDVLYALYEDPIFGNNYPYPYEDMKGAVKVCIGQTFIAGLMPDNTVRVRITEIYDYPIIEGLPVGKVSREKYEEIQKLLTEDFKSINNAIDIVDINSYEDCLVALKKDGTLLVAGYYD